MKARVIATGEIVDGNAMVSFQGDDFYLKELEAIQDDPDYWTRLEHQYAGMAMQGILACEEWKTSPREGVSFAGEVALQAQEIAHALVEKYKKEEK